MNMNINKIMVELQPNSTRAGFRYESDCVEPTPYWDGDEVVSSTELWHDFCGRVQRRMRRTGEELDDAFEAECSRGGIEADYMDDMYGGVHFVVSEDTLGTELVSESYIIAVADALTDMGYPTRPKVSQILCEEDGCGIIPEQALDEAMIRAEKVVLEDALKTLGNGVNAAYALSNPEATEHAAVIDALKEVYGQNYDDYMTYYDWDYMDDDEKSKYGNYEEYADECVSQNGKIINEAIERINEKIHEIEDELSLQEAKNQEMKENPKEENELREALKILTGWYRQVEPIRSILEPNAIGHEDVVEALEVAFGEGFSGYMTTNIWKEMSNEESEEKYDGDYVTFLVACDEVNKKIINEAIKILKGKI